MSGEFRQCQTFFSKSVGGNVGGILKVLGEWVRRLVTNIIEF